MANFVSLQFSSKNKYESTRSSYTWSNHHLSNPALYELVNAYILEEKIVINFPGSALTAWFSTGWYLPKATSSSSIVQVVALSACLAISQSWAADSKKWEMLANCQYVAHNDNDGDSFHVHCDAKDFSLRLYFVDAPETNLTFSQRTLEQSEYFGISLDETVKGGKAAREFVASTLREPFTVWTRWATAGGRSKEPRFYGIVLVGANNLDEILIRKGLARPKGVRPNLPTGEKSKAHQEKLSVLEADAKKQKVGLWANATEKKIEPVRP